MTESLIPLLITAVSIAFIHTVIGPDHYIPFIAMSKAQKWSATKTAIVTFLSGMAHVLSSVVLGLIGIAFGLALGSLELFESTRGEVAGWFLLAFGLVYFVWGIRKAFKHKSHSHLPADMQKDGKNITPWVLFAIFIFGPCEPLIPILMYPAATQSITGVVAVAIAFSIVTIGTMMSLVMASYYGLGFVPAKSLHRFSHAMAGLAVLLCGLAIKLGL